MTCECCREKEAGTEEASSFDNSPYHLCKICRKRLLHHALRPAEFFNLSAIHGQPFHLHDDFYDDRGTALQPEEKVIDANLFPFPELNIVKNDLNTLLEYACVEYVTSQRVIDWIKQYDKKAVLNGLINKVNYNRSINYKAYEITGKVLSKYAASWIRSEWEKRRKNEVLIFAEAICSCLEFNEALTILTTEIESVENNELAEQSKALLFLQNSKTLDWIEHISYRIVNVPETWGVLAASSKFSWARAESWLLKGRPLSLISLDALVYCTTRGERINQALWLKQHPSSLEDQPATEIIAKKLHQYLEIDNVPRTRAAVAQIEYNLI